MKRELYLHIGHGKTGSSFLQSILSKNRDFLLKEKEILYPVEKRDLSAQGKISSGNGRILQKALKDGDLPALMGEYNASKVLFSSELLFSQVDWENVDVLFDGQLFSKVVILLFVRNPLELLSSNFQQSVKRGGYFGSFDEYALSFRFFQKLASTIDLLQSKQNSELTIVNYSRKEPVDQSLANWLDLDSIPIVPDAVINRSMSRSELFLQKELNKYFGKSGDLASDEFCNKLPNIESDKFAPSPHVYGILKEREEPFLNKVNEMIPSQEKLTFEELRPDNGVESQISLNEDQIRIFCETIAKRLKRKTG